MKYTKEEVIEKVRKCLALAAGTTPEEAETAMLQAQRLMAKYHLSMAEVEDATKESSVENVDESVVDDIFLSRPWVRLLADVVAKNFRCTWYISTPRGTRRHRCCMVGYETDVEVAAAVFKAAYTYAERSGSNRAQLYNDRGLSSQGVKANFCLGFVRGLKQAYADQVEQHQELALMVVTPQEALDALKDMSEFKGGMKQSYYKDANYSEGFNTGYDFGSKRMLPER